MSRPSSGRRSTAARFTMEQSTKQHLGISIVGLASPHAGSNSDRFMDRIPPPLRVPLTVAFYMVAGLTLVMVNKSVLSMDIKLPISLLLLQTFVCVCLIWGLSAMKVVDAPKLNMNKVKKLIPLVAGNVIVLCLNTFTLRYVDASVFQIARGGTLPCTIVAQFLLNGRTTSVLCIFAAVIIVVGFMTGFAESHEDAEMESHARLGFFLGFLSSIGTAINTCYSAKGVEVVDGNTVHLVFYNQTMLLVGLLPLFLISGEYDGLTTVLGDSVEGYRLVKNIIITGTFAFLINLAGFLQIKMTSPATHIVSGAVRGVLQTLLAFAVLGESVSSVRVAGTVIIVVGSSLYTYAKSLDV